MANRADLPETLLKLGGTAPVMRNPAAAEAAFREAVHLDPQRTDAWVMLVRITAATKGRAAALDVVEEARRINPADETLRSFAAELGTP